jgi:RNA polymerase sigma-70 factor (ECF subfamily)
MTLMIAPRRAYAERTPTLRRPDTQVRPRRVRDLVDRLTARDEAAYAVLLREHVPRMMAVAQRYLPRAHDAEDAVQDALVCVVRSVAAFKRKCSLDTWLHRIVANCALMILRRQRRKPAMALEEGTLEGGAALPGRRSSPPAAFEIAAAEETRILVRGSIDRLPEVERCVLLLRGVETLTVRQIAEVMDIGASTVRVTLHRARRRLEGTLRPRALL